MPSRKVQALPLKQDLHCNCVQHMCSPSLDRVSSNSFMNVNLLLMFYFGPEKDICLLLTREIICLGVSTCMSVWWSEVLFDGYAFILWQHCPMRFMYIVVYDLKSVEPLEFKLVAPMPEQLKTNTMHFYMCLLTPQRNALLRFRLVLGWVQRNSNVGSLDRRLLTMYVNLYMKLHSLAHQQASNV